MSSPRKLEPDLQVVTIKIRLIGGTIPFEIRVKKSADWSGGRRILCSAKSCSIRMAPIASAMPKLKVEISVVMSLSLTCINTS